MIYLTEGNIPLNAAYDDNITQEANSTYQLIFKFPTNNILWQRLREETFLTADDLHGEQDFVIFEVEKKHGYIQVYANQVFTLLNNYVVNSISLDRVTGSTALSQFAGSITRNNPFSFFSDIEDRHTFNVESKNAMEAFAKDKHSIIGQWGGDLVRHGYQVRLLKNGGSENESLFMYKKNLSSYQHKTSTKSLKTRITFTTTVKGEGEKAPDRKFSVVVDSPLVNKYSQIYEDVIEVNDQDVKDEASLRKYGEQYYRTSLCDMMEDSLELEVVGQSDVPVQIYDIVSLFHDVYNLDVRKKITKYTYSPMGKKLKTIGFGQFKSGLANAIGSVVSEAVKGETQQFQSNFERQLAKEIKNADLAFDRKNEELKNQFTDEVNAIKAKTEENKRALSDEINQRFQEFSPTGLDEIKTKAEEALKKAGASANLAEEAKRISDENKVDFQRVKETNQLYERMLGSTDSNVASNIARMALTSELFEVEVGKRFSNHTNLFYAPTKIPKYISSVATDKHLERVSYGDHDGIRINYTESMTGWLGVRFPLTKKFVKQGESLGYRIEIEVDKVPKDGRLLIQLLDNTAKLGMYYNSQISLNETGNQVFTGYLDIPRTGELNEYSLRFTLMTPGDIVIHKPMIIDKRIIPDEFVDSTDYNSEYNRVTMSLLQDSFAIKALNSAGDIIAGINVGANGNNRIIGKATHITGDTLIDNAVIKSAMIDKLKTANFEAGSVTTNILDAEAVTAEKVKFDTAFIQKLVSQQAFIDELFAKQATITKIQSIDFTGNHIKGGVLTSLNGNSTFDLNAGRIQMQSSPTGWRTSWDSNGIAFRGPNDKVWGAMGGDSGGGVGIYMRGDHAFNLVVNHTDQGKSYAYTALRVKYGDGTYLQFSPGGSSYNLLLLFNDIYRNIELLHKNKATTKPYTYSMYGPLK
ncbi:phage tail spike protein [Granulicatella adiacens]|uniref:phage tail spike protein n=1 Tax=Granulicatella adiacens TaxID=46124 RepID=UPI003C6EDB97